MKRGGFRSIGALLTRAVALSGLLLAAGAVARADENKIDLRLFGENVVDNYDGCRIAFWQDDRDPATDAYAYVLYAPVPDAEALPAWIKIGKEVKSVMPVETGAQDGGMLAPVLLYRDEDNTVTVLIEINKQERVGDDIHVDDALLTFIVDKKFPFSVRARGIDGCPGHGEAKNAEGEDETAGLIENAVTLGPRHEFVDLKGVPEYVLRAVATQAPDCAPNNTAGYGTWHAISPAMKLWQIPCNVYAASSSSVLVTSLNGDDEYASVLVAPVPPRRGMSESQEIINVDIEPDVGQVTSFSSDIDESCGVFERFQLVEEEGEAIGLELLEYRERLECDGADIAHENFPLVYARP